MMEIYFINKKINPKNNLHKILSLILIIKIIAISLQSHHHKNLIIKVNNIKITIMTNTIITKYNNLITDMVL